MVGFDGNDAGRTIFSGIDGHETMIGSYVYKRFGWPLTVLVLLKRSTYHSIDVAFSLNVVAKQTKMLQFAGTDNEVGPEHGQATALCLACRHCSVVRHGLNVVSVTSGVRWGVLGGGGRGRGGQCGNGAAGGAGGGGSVLEIHVKVHHSECNAGC